MPRLFLFALLAFSLHGQTVVAVDGFHNRESKMPDHYRWEGTRNGGYSQLARLLGELGAQTRTLEERCSAASLSGIDLLIVVDPDTPAETDAPNYIEAAEIEALEQWVKKGGKLVLLGNDKGNAEFEHFNRLAGRFGIEFVETTYPKMSGKAILVAGGTHAIFEKSLQAYLVEVAPLKLAPGAEVILEDKGTPLMALVRAGRGTVFALGDPWIYNEYINHKDNRRIAGNLFRLLLKK